ncbi:MAG TPA: hypothetical protein VGR62_19580 [Candidatus Binatia bacterium]|nr:hypothetical protein [Candidatus Binatia bacterium]
MSKRHLAASVLCAVLLAVGGIVLPHQADAGGGGLCSSDFQCNDFNTCTTDACINRFCSHVPINCDDSDPCTADSCSMFLGCMNSLLSCDDGDECTDDVCVDGTTCGYTPVSCDDNDACTVDSCAMVGGCGHAPITDPSCGGIPVAGSRLRVDDVGPPRGKRNEVTLSDATIDLTGLDPTVSGATAIIGKPGGASVTIDLPASGWTKGGTRSRADYKYKSDTAGGVLAARLRDGRSIRFSARAAGVYGLGGASQGTLGVIVEIGSGRFCGEFGGTVKIDDGSHFFAVRAPSPPACPDLGAH